MKALLNFTYISPSQRVAEQEQAYRERVNRARRDAAAHPASTAHHKHAKQLYLNSNYHFVLSAFGDNTEQALYNPDFAADWSDVECVVYPTANPPLCPICLEPPRAGYSLISFWLFSSFVFLFCDIT
jgi:hypothetical protein